MITATRRRVVITGISVISPLGNSVDELWDGIVARRSGVRRLPQQGEFAPAFTYAGIAENFSGKIGDFGELEAAQKKQIRKGLKLMCREIKMGVAAAQLALQHSQPAADSPPERTGVVFGCDHITTLPEEFSDAIAACVDDNKKFQFDRWANQGLPQVTPIWLLKYLPNMPASHVAIYNDFRGPNNSLTYREPSANLALGEAVTTIQRGSADRMIAGTTGSACGPLRALHVASQSEISLNGDDPAAACRPFDAKRSGMVAGEGAAAMVLEDRDTAMARGAKIYGEILGHSSSVVLDAKSVADLRTAVANSIRGALRAADISADSIGHIHAHGLGTRHADREEALGIQDALGEHTGSIPVTAAKSYFGNLGAASGMVELASSLVAMKEGKLFPVLNYSDSDPDCTLQIAGEESKAGDTALNINFSPTGQASALIVAAAK